MSKGVINLRSFIISALVITSLFSCGSKENNSISVTPVTGILVSESTTNLEITDTYYIITRVLPKTATDKSLTFSSSDQDIATVSKTGLVTAIKTGEVTIEIKALNNVKSKIIINVKSTEKLLGNWDGTKLTYILKTGEISVDDLIIEYSTIPAKETTDKKAIREKTLKGLYNNKGIFEELWQAEMVLRQSWWRITNRIFKQIKDR